MTSPTEKRIKRTHQRALLASLSKDDKKVWQYVESHPIPKPAKGQVLVRTTYVGLNPFDWQGVAYKYAIEEQAKAMGRDGAGVVLELGEGVDQFNKGDRVWFCANSSAKGTGAFQEYSVHSVNELGHVPDYMSDLEAATLGTGLITAGVALFRTLDIPLESWKEDKAKEDKPWMLIWGGAGITGVFLIQLAVLLGYRVICLASKENHEYVRALGARVVLDRWLDHDVLVEKIREETDDDVLIAIDNVGSTTATLCQRVLQGSKSWREDTGLLPSLPTNSTPARLVPLAGSPTSSPTTTTDSIRSTTSLRISFSTTFYNHPLFSIPLIQKLDSLLLEKRIVPARTQVVEGGLASIEKSLEDLRHGRIKGGYKLIARVSDTPAVVVVGEKRAREEDAVEAVEKKVEIQLERSVKRPRKSEITYLSKAEPAVQDAVIRQAWQCMTRDG